MNTFEAKKVELVFIGMDFGGYSDNYEVEIGCFLNPDDAEKCIDWCQQMIDDRRLDSFDYVYSVTYEIEDLETVMKRLEERFSPYLNRE